MGCTKLLLFFLLQSATDFSIEENSVSETSYFEIRENKQLKGYVVKRFDSPSLLSCGQQCMRNAWCTSTNYEMSSKKYGKGACELNKHDISLINENDNFCDQQGVTFSMLLQVICMMQFWILIWVDHKSLVFAKRLNFLFLLNVKSDLCNEKSSYIFELPIENLPPIVFRVLI